MTKKTKTDTFDLNKALSRFVTGDKFFGGSIPSAGVEKQLTEHLKARALAMLRLSVFANVGRFSELDDLDIANTTDDNLSTVIPAEPSQHHAICLTTGAEFGSNKYGIGLARILSPKKVVDIDELKKPNARQLIEYIDVALVEVLTGAMDNLISKKSTIAPSKLLPEYSWHTCVLGTPGVFMKREAYCVELFAYMLSGGAVIINK